MVDARVALVSLLVPKKEPLLSMNTGNNSDLNCIEEV